MPQKPLTFEGSFPVVDKNEAVAELEKAIELEPDNAIYQETLETVQDTQGR